MEHPRAVLEGGEEEVKTHTVQYTLFINKYLCKDTFINTVLFLS